MNLNNKVKSLVIFIHLLKRCEKNLINLMKFRQKFRIYLISSLSKESNKF